MWQLGAIRLEQVELQMLEGYRCRTPKISEVFTIIVGWLSPSEE